MGRAFPRQTSWQFELVSMLTNSSSRCLSNPQIVGGLVAGVGDPEAGSTMPTTTACQWRKRKLSCLDNLESTTRGAETLAAIAAPFLLRFRYPAAPRNKMRRAADRPRG